MKKIYEGRKIIIIDTEKETAANPVRIFVGNNEIVTDYLCNLSYSSLNMEDEEVIERIIKKYYITSGKINKDIASLEDIISKRKDVYTQEQLSRANEQLDNLKNLLAMEDRL